MADFDMMMTKSLGLVSDPMAAEVISKKKNVIASPVPRMVSSPAEPELIYKGK